MLNSHCARTVLYCNSPFCCLENGQEDMAVEIVFSFYYICTWQKTRTLDYFSRSQYGLRWFNQVSRLFPQVRQDYSSVNDNDTNSCEFWSVLATCDTSSRQFSVSRFNSLRHQLNLMCREIWFGVKPKRWRIAGCNQYNIPENDWMNSFLCNASGIGRTPSQEVTV